ncbi:hypothetical protein [Prosthecobacter sp.]|uniref:hypothetical protein n=1 Tax=Prosthecobacter sp. TaxID=1965333 RepID=UPI00378485ED
MLQPSDYCELNRRFVQFKHEASTDDFALQSYDSHSAYFEWGSLGWGELMGKPGVIVILGEPGSGRSYEFKARCQVLCDQGAAAFYLELHRLVDASPAEVLGDQDSPRLEGWQQSSDTAVFFLDAVDEAKVERVSDFGLALENFARALGAHRSRATVFISSRISEWSPEMDLRLVAETLSTAPEEKKEKQGASEDDSDEEFDPDAETNVSASTNEEKKAKSEIPVYVIAPLKRDQVAKLAQALGVADADSFLAALDQRHAWEFARRPSDVRFLVQYWKKHGQIGSLTQMLDESLLLLLAETEEKQHRSVKFPLTQEQARHGAEALAAATLFCRTLDFEISDTATLGRRPGLRPLDCLPPQWTDMQSKALLDRPLFDSAIYGRVRFHHRRLAEYLAACWLRNRMQRQCPPPVLHDLLFVVLPSGRRVIRPSRAPVAVWLACIGEGGWVNDLRTWLLDSSPQSFLRFGDPSLLPVGFRDQIIDAIVLRFRDRTHVRIETDASAMSRLADPELAATLSRHVLDPQVGPGIKAELLDFAVHGRVSGCVDAALAVLRMSSGERSLERSAIDLITSCGSPTALAELAALVAQDQCMAARHVGLLASALFPAQLDVTGLRALLTLRQSSSRIWRLEQLFSHTPKGWSPFAVLEMLVGMVLTSPDMIPHEGFVAERWITGLISSLIKAIFEGREISAVHLDTVAKACWLLRKEHPNGDGTLHSIPKFEESTRRFQGLRRAMFWLAVRLDPEKKSVRSVRHDGWIYFHDDLHFTFCAEDLEWLIQDASNHPDIDLRAIAAWLVFNQWQWKRVPSKAIRRLKRAVRDLPDIYRELKKRVRLVVQARLLWWWYWPQQKRLFSKWTWKKHWKAVKSFVSRWRDTWNLHTKIRHIRSGRFIHWVERLTRETSSDSRWAARDWSKLIAKRGPRITRATQQGCVAVWHSYEPSAINSSDGTPYGVIVGLCALQFLYQNNRRVFAQFTPAEARRAARYAVNEMNGYSEWLEELARQHPDAVRDVLVECIRHEWNAPLQNGFWPRHLDSTGREKSTLAPLVSPVVAELVAGSPPANVAVLSAAISLLIRHEGIEREELARLSAQKLVSLRPEDPGYLAWLVVCLQTNAAVALEHLEERGRNEADAARDSPGNNYMVVLCSVMRGDMAVEWLPRIAAPDHLCAPHAARFIRLVYRFVDPSYDITHADGEPYSPGQRDDAQSYRSAILTRLSELPDPEAEGALRSLLTLPECAADHDWIRHLIDERMERMADGAAFHARDIPNFERHNEAVPRSSAELFRTVQRRLAAIKHDVEHADQSLRMSVRAGDREVQLRRFIALELSRRSQQCYTAPQESVIQNEERLDIRVENPDFPGPVVIEVKLGDLRSRTVASLLTDLEGQLVQRYLRDENSRHGIYLVGYTGERTNWEHPETGERLSFDEVISLLDSRADEIQNNNSAVEGLKVVGIDFRLPRN